jgi:Domain of unknown function (DUF6249)
MNHMGITLVSIAFWVFMAIVAVAGMIQDYRKRQLLLEPLRIAIEHGQQLSPEMLAKLVGRGHAEQVGELDPKLLRVGGIITCASGIGVALFAPFVAMVFPPYHWIVLGVGTVAICVGVGLTVAAKSLRA